MAGLLRLLRYGLVRRGVGGCGQIYLDGNVSDLDAWWIKQLGVDRVEEAQVI